MWVHSVIIGNELAHQQAKIATLNAEVTVIPGLTYDDLKT